MPEIRRGTSPYLVTITDPRKRESFLEVFGTDTVPVTGPVPTLRNLPGYSKAEPVYLLDMDALDDTARERLVRYLSDRFTWTYVQVLLFIEQQGFPIPVEDCEPAGMKKPVRTCRVCGCTDEDCRQCIEAQGYPCYWVEEDLCSRCAPQGLRFPPHALRDWKYYWRRYLGWVPVQFCMVCGNVYWGGFPRVWMIHYRLRLTWLPWWKEYCSRKCADHECCE